MLAWYGVYVDIYRRLSNKGPPRSYNPCSAAGGDADGVRRMRGSPFGSDVVDQPAFQRWFGEDAFAVVVSGYNNFNSYAYLGGGQARALVCE